MSKAETDFPNLQSTDLQVQDTVSEEETAVAARQQARNIRRLVPVIVAGSLSFTWTIACLVYVLTADINLLQNTSLADGATLIAGYATPIAVFWLIALAFQRTDPLLERRLAMAQNLHRAIAPVEVAEQRLTLLNRTLRKELQNIDAVADLASNRIQNLEDRFQEQISNLFSATADTEARTTSIRDLLERERGAISDITKDVEARFNSLENMVQKIADKLEGAGSTAAATADHAKERLETSLTNFNETTENFEIRLEKAGKTVSDRAEKVQAIADDVELRLHTVTESTLSGMERFRTDVQGLEGRSAELAEHMTTQATVLKDLAELAATESAKIEENLKTHVGEVRAAASEALNETNDVSAAVSERAQAMSNHVLETVGKAKNLLDEAGQSLAEHCSAALSTSEHVNKTTLETTAATGAAVQEHAEKADQILMEGLNKAQQALGAAMESISEHGETTVQQAEDAANRTLQHIRQLRAGVEDQLDEIANTAKSTEETMVSAADAISEKSSNLAHQSGETVTELSAVRAQMTLQSDVIADVLNETRMKLSRLEDDLTNQRDVLNNTSTEAADRVIEAAERFANHSQLIQVTASDVHESLNTRSSELAGIIDQIGTTAEISQEHINAANETLVQKSTEVREELKDSSAALGSAAEAFAGERQRIREETDSVVNDLNRSSDAMGAEVTRFTESSMEAAGRLDSASQSLMDQTSRAQEDMKKSVETIHTELSASMDEISNKANERITFLQEEMEATLSRVLHNYQDTADQAEKESALLASRLGNEAAKISQQAEQFIEKSSEIEKRIAAATKNDFARTSQLLMESLQSTSIDINKALSDDLPDKTWEAYLSGDKSVFMRRTLKIGTRATRKAIAQKFKAEPEFRESVARYCRDFEGLMERVMLGDKGSALSVTLISSDMGKLYILLGQSLKKFS